MDLTYDKAMRLYVKSKDAVDVINADAKDKALKHVQKMALLLEWIETNALKDKLKNVPVKGVGTGYFTTVSTSSVADREVFMNFVKENELWDLIETRATKKSVESYIDANNAPVPGVTFSKVQVFRIRKPTAKDVD